MAVATAEDVSVTVTAGEAGLFDSHVRNAALALYPGRRTEVASWAVLEDTLRRSSQQEVEATTGTANPMFAAAGAADVDVEIGGATGSKVLSAFRPEDATARRDFLVEGLLPRL